MKKLPTAPKTGKKIMPVKSKSKMSPSDYMDAFGAFKGTVGKAKKNPFRKK